MSRRTPTLVFPGQGTLNTVVLARQDVRARFDFVLARIADSPLQSAGAEAARRLVPAVRWPEPMTPGAVSLFVFAASVAQGRALLDGGVRPGVLLGHAFGEIAALVCGGAIPVEHGAEIVAQRTAVLEASADAAGGMAACRAPVAAVERLVARVGPDDAAVAVENSPEEVVVAGTTHGIDVVRRLAVRAGIGVRALRSPWALHHHALMAAAAADLAARLRHIVWRAPAVPVFSPILARYYQASEDLAACLAAHLTRRVRFADAIRVLAAAGAGPFITCGPLTGLDACIRSASTGTREADAGGVRGPGVGVPVVVR